MEVVQAVFGLFWVGFGMSDVFVRILGLGQYMDGQGDLECKIGCEEKKSGSNLCHEVIPACCRLSLLLVCLLWVLARLCVGKEDCNPKCNLACGQEVFRPN